MAKPTDEQAPLSVEPKSDLVQRDEINEDEEKILSGRPDVNMPALLTKDVKGG